MYTKKFESPKYFTTVKKQIHENLCTLMEHKKI